MNKEKKHFYLILEDEQKQKISISTKSSLKELDESTINFEDLEDFLDVMSECYDHKFVKAYIEKNNDWLNHYQIKFASDDYKIDDLRQKLFEFLNRHQELLKELPFSKLSKSDEMYNYQNGKISRLSIHTVSQIVYNYLKNSYTNQRQAYFMLKENGINVKTSKKAYSSPTKTSTINNEFPINKTSSDYTMQKLLEEEDYDSLYALYDASQLEEMGINIGDSFRQINTRRHH